MRNRYLPAMAAVLLLFACQKSGQDSTTPIPEDGKKFAVNFNVSGTMQQASGEFARVVDSSLLQNAQLLVYTSFDPNTGKLQKAIIKKNTDPTFGQFTDSLPKGRYLIAVTAIKDSIYSRQTIYNESVVFRYPGSDAFYKKIVVNVDSTVNENMVLERVVSKLALTVKGKVPNNARTIVISPLRKDGPTMYGLPGELTYFTGEVRPNSSTYLSWTYKVPDSIQGKPAIVFDGYIINPSGNRTISLHLDVLDSLNQRITHKYIYDVQLETNKVTQLSGFLFDSVPTTGGLGVKVNTQWKKDSIIAQF